MGQVLFTIGRVHAHTQAHLYTNARATSSYIHICVCYPIHIYTHTQSWYCELGFFLFFFLHFSRSRSNNNIYKKGGASEKYSGTCSPQGEKRPLLGLIVPWWDDFLPGTFIIIHNIYIEYYSSSTHPPSILYFIIN